MSDIIPDGKKEHEPGAKKDGGKARVGLMFESFPRALLEVAKLVTFGAEKYSPLGHLKVEDGFNRYDDAKGRHLLEGYIDRIDPDSEMYHMTHEAWNALVKLELFLRGDHVHNDSRSDPGQKE